MSQPRIFYVLGAGASVPLVRMTPQLRSFVKNEYDKIGIYPVSRAIPSPLYERVIGKDHINFDIITNIAPGTLDLLVQTGLRHSTGGSAPPQYAIFNTVGYPSTIFSFNLDGLAAAYCGRRHWVLEPHGTIDRYWLELPHYDEMLYATAAYDLVLPYLVAKHLPGPEPWDITQTAAYVAGRYLFNQSTALVFIGYSFARWRGGFDDAESFEYFIDLLSLNPLPTLVVSPNPDELVELLQQRLRSRRVWGVQVRWDLLTSLLLNTPQVLVSDLLGYERNLEAFRRAYLSMEERY